MANEKKYPGACLDCGGSVTVTPDPHEPEPLGICVNCGPVAWDVSFDKAGQPFDGFSKMAWLTRSGQNPASKQ
jgi:hypothetical protein